MNVPPIVIPAGAGRTASADLAGRPAPEGGEPEGASFELALGLAIAGLAPGPPQNEVLPLVLTSGAPGANVANGSQPGVAAIVAALARALEGLPPSGTAAVDSARAPDAPASPGAQEIATAPRGGTTLEAALEHVPALKADQMSSAGRALDAVENTLARTLAALAHGAEAGVAGDRAAAALRGATVIAARAFSPADAASGAPRNPPAVAAIAAAPNPAADPRRGSQTDADAGVPDRRATPLPDVAPATAPIAPAAFTLPAAAASGGMPALDTAPGAGGAASVTLGGPARAPAADRVTLAIEDAAGIEGRLRVALRGGTLHATIVMPDAAAAARMESTLGELHRALAERGFGDVRIAVQSPATPGTADAVRTEHRDPRDPRSAHQHSAREENRSGDHPQRRRPHDRPQEG